MYTGCFAEGFAGTVRTADFFRWTWRGEGRRRRRRQWALATLVDARPGDVPSASIVPSKLPTIIYANHFCVEKSVAAEPF